MMKHAHEFAALNVPGPTVTEDTRAFWEGVAQERFLMPRCNDCHQWIFYPRPHCPTCWSDSLAWHEASGEGILKSFTVIHRPGHPGWQAVAPYALGIVRLSEGPSMLTTLVDLEIDFLRIDMPVTVRYVRVGEQTLPMFTAAQAHTP